MKGLNAPAARAAKHHLVALATAQGVDKVVTGP